MPGLVWPGALGVVFTDEALPEPGSDEELVRVVPPSDGTGDANEESAAEPARDSGEPNS